MPKLVVVATFLDLHKADLVKLMLRSNNIEAHVLDRNAMGIAGITALGGFRVQVFEEDLEKASALIKDFEA